MNIYVASSWRNNIQQKIVALLRLHGYQVYDFKNPRPGDNGFHWSEIEPSWKTWSPQQFRDSLNHPVAVAGFMSDMDALKACDVCVLVLPCGRSAHLEAGWAAGAQKPMVILLSDNDEPELMYKVTPYICTDEQELLIALEEIERSLPCSNCGELHPPMANLFEEDAHDGSCVQSKRAG